MFQLRKSTKYSMFSFNSQVGTFVHGSYFCNMSCQINNSIENLYYIRLYVSVHTLVVELKFILIVFFQIEAGFNKSTKCYEIRTHDSYRKYEQVFISYGPHDNQHLLLEYGFTVDNNPYDAYHLDYGTFQLIAPLVFLVINRWNNLSIRYLKAFLVVSLHVPLS